MRDINDVLDDVVYGVKELKLAMPDYDVADAYYQGEDPELFLSDALRLYLRENYDAFRLNLAAIPVDTVADRLNIASITSTTPGAQIEIDKIILENEFYTWSNPAMRDAEKLGDMFIGVFIGDDGRPVMSPLDPYTLRVFYDEDLERIPEYVLRYWVEDDNGEDLERATLTYPDEIWKFYKNAGKWQLWDEDGETFPLPNLLKDLPVGHLRNGMPYGAPGHRRSYGMQQLITKAVLNMVANLDFMGFPQRWVLKNVDQAQKSGMAAPTRRDGVAELTTNSSPGLTAGPSKLWELLGQGVGEFTPTEVTQFIALLDWAALSMARAERLPVRLYSDPSGQQPSGDSQRENDRSLKERVSARKRSFGAGIIKAFQKALAIVGIPNAEVKIEWVPDEVSGDLTVYQSANEAADLILKAFLEARLIPFVRIKLAELGHSSSEIDSIFGTTSIVSDSNNGSTSSDELDSADVTE